MKILYTIVFVLAYMGLSATPPTNPSHSYYFNAIDGGYLNIGWQAGNGARRIMICKQGSPVTFVPQNGIDYNHNTEFGDGQEVAPGEYVVYDHFSSSFFLTGLTPGTQYFFRVYEYNGTGSTTEYLTSVFLSGSGSTSGIPTTQTRNASFVNITTNSVNLNWENGNGLRRLIVVREGSPVNADPVNNQPYNPSFTFGNGAQVGTGNFAVYGSSSSSTSVSNLKAGTQYFFSFYEYNGGSQPQYLTPAYTTSVTTRSVPTIATSGLSITKKDGKELFLGWTSGNGQRRIIVAKQGSDITSVPANGVDYNANQVFGTGQQLAAGEFVVYDDNFTAATITGLNPATVYYFKIFEYDGTGTSTAYLTSSFASVNGSTAATPALQAIALPMLNITSNSMRVQFTPGDGRARLIIGRKNAAVNVTPSDFTAYTANSNFGTGTDLGNGNFVLSNSTEAFATIHQLDPNSTYHFAIFEYNGFNQPLYLSPAATISGTTLVALPVKLSKWEAIPANGRIKLQWTTSSEVDASHFIIERSQDGINFNAIANVPAAGNSQSDISYTREDANPLPGKSYYRLKMVDIDTRFEYSPTRVVLISSTPVAKLAANPVQHTLEVITSTSSVNGKDEWQIIGLSGQVVRKGTISPGRIEVNVSTLPAGSYWFRMNMNNEKQVLYFVKQ